jgi:hypothetical protein
MSGECADAPLQRTSGLALGKGRAYSPPPALSERRYRETCGYVCELQYDEPLRRLVGLSSDQ